MWEILTEEKIFATRLKGGPVRITAIETAKEGSGAYLFNKNFDVLMRAGIICWVPAHPETFVYEVKYPLRVLSVIEMKDKDYSMMHGRRYEIGDILRVTGI